MDASISKSAPVLQELALLPLTSLCRLHAVEALVEGNAMMMLKINATILECVLMASSLLQFLVASQRILTVARINKLALVTLGRALQSPIKLLAAHVLAFLTMASAMMTRKTSAMPLVFAKMEWF